MKTIINGVTVEGTPVQLLETAKKLGTTLPSTLMDPPEGYIHHNGSIRCLKDFSTKDLKHVLIFLSQSYLEKLVKNSASKRDFLNGYVMLAVDRDIERTFVELHGREA